METKEALLYISIHCDRLHLIQVKRHILQKLETLRSKQATKSNNYSQSDKHLLTYILSILNQTRQTVILLKYSQSRDCRLLEIEHRVCLSKLHSYQDTLPFQGSIFDFERFTQLFRWNREYNCSSKIALLTFNTISPQ